MGNLAAVLDREAEVRWVSRKMMPEPLVWIFLLGNRSPGIVIGFPPQREANNPFYKGSLPNALMARVWNLLGTRHCHQRD